MSRRNLNPNPPSNHPQPQFYFYNNVPHTAPLPPRSSGTEQIPDANSSLASDSQGSARSSGREPIRDCIIDAILASPRGKLRSSEIREVLRKKYPDLDSPSLSDNVRHHLTYYKCFVKYPKERGMFGKGALWMYEPVINDGPRYITKFNSSAVSKRSAPSRSPPRVQVQTGGSSTSSSFTINRSQPQPFLNMPSVERPTTPATPHTPSTPYLLPLFPPPPPLLAGSSFPTSSNPYALNSPWPPYSGPEYGASTTVAPFYSPQGYPTHNGFNFPPSNQNPPFQ